MSEKKTIGELIDKVIDDSEKKTFGENIKKPLDLSEKKTDGERADDVKNDAAGAAHDMKKSVKKAVAADDPPQISMRDYQQLWGQAERENRKDEPHR
jgi:hypothetical protein